MEMHNVLTAQTRAELRAWLTANSNKERECWVVIGLKPAPDRVLYLDAVEEALCYGWIDSTKKKISTNQFIQRLSPRKPRSSWTELNKERVRRLERLGRMTEAGRRVLPDMDPASFATDPAIDSRLRADPAVYAQWEAFPPLYRRIRIDTIQSVRSQPELYEARLAKLIDQTRAGKLYGQWHDGGRLLEDDADSYASTT